jgi:endonuclease YncB( thermonuclease family)
LVAPATAGLSPSATQRASRSAALASGVNLLREKGIHTGDRSRQHLADVCFKKQAVVKRQTTNRYGRTVARVERDGIDANTEQVRVGMAWVFDRYITDLSRYAVQEEARAARRGLWADSHAISHVPISCST